MPPANGNDLDNDNPFLCDGTCPRRCLSVTTLVGSYPNAIGGSWLVEDAWLQGFDKEQEKEAKMLHKRERTVPNNIPL